MTATERAAAPRQEGTHGTERSLCFEALFNASPNNYVVMAPDFTIIDANEAYLEATGRRREEICGRNMFEAFPGGPHDPEGHGVRLLRSSLERVVRTGKPDTLALIRYAIPGEDGTFEDRYWSATHTPLLDETGRVAQILQHTVDVTELQRLRRAAAPGTSEGRLENEVLRRAEVLQRENTALDEQWRHFRRLFEQAPGFMAVLSGPQHTFELVNNAYAQLVGDRSVLGRPVSEALPEVAEQGFIDLLDTVYRTGEAFVGREMKARLQRSSEAPLDVRYLDLVYQPIAEADGRVSGIFVQGNDVTERVLAQRRQQMLLDELNHRVKNTLATVQSIAAQTLRSASSPGAFTEAFQARLLALAHVHDALTRGNWDSANLEEILGQELRPHGASRVSLDGPRVLLSPRATLALGMVFHELATNAAKYGALSVPGGHVAVRWSVELGDEVPWLSLSWREFGGPTVSPPTRRGFGSRLISRSIADELLGSGQQEFLAEGLLFRCRVPLVEGGKGGV